MCPRWIVVTLGVLLGCSAAAAPAGEEVNASAADRRGAVVQAPDERAQEAQRKQRVRSRTERAKREAEFNQLDSDGDGYLSRQELTAKTDLQPGPDVLDSDDDGKISRSEFAAVETTSVGPETP